MILSFNNFFLENILKNEAKSIVESERFLCSLGIFTVGIYLRDGPFLTDIGFVNLHPSKVTHWVLYINDWICKFRSVNRYSLGIIHK